MEPSRHMRSREVRTQGVCGAGYTWPSGVLLTDDPEKVTCTACKRVMDR